MTWALNQAAGFDSLREELSLHHDFAAGPWTGPTITHHMTWNIAISTPDHFIELTISLCWFTKFTLVVSPPFWVAQAVITSPLCLTSEPGGHFLFHTPCHLTWDPKWLCLISPPVISEISIKDSADLTSLYAASRFAGSLDNTWYFNWFLRPFTNITRVSCGVLFSLAVFIISLA